MTFLQARNVSLNNWLRPGKALAIPNKHSYRDEFNIDSEMNVKVWSGTQNSACNIMEFKLIIGNIDSNLMLHMPICLYDPSNLYPQENLSHQLTHSYSYPVNPAKNGHIIR